MCGLVPAPAAHLHCFVGDSPSRFGRPHFAHRGLDSQIAHFAIEQRRSKKRHRFHRKNVAGHLGNFPGNRSVLADRHAPLNAFARPLARDFQQALGKTNARSGQREPPGIQRRQRDF